MTCRGRVRNGVVVPDDAVKLPEGAEVRIVLPDQRVAPNATDQPRRLLDRLESVVGTARGLPPDAATNVEHYLYGRPKA